MAEKLLVNKKFAIISLIGCLVGCLVGCLFGCLVGCLVVWLVGCLFTYLISYLANNYFFLLCCQSYKSQTANSKCHTMIEYFFYRY